MNLFYLNFFSILFRQNVERDFLMEMERIQSEIDQAIHNTDSSNKTAESLKKEILLIETAIAEKKRQVNAIIIAEILRI